jgi:hypothetical protein
MSTGRRTRRLRRLASPSRRSIRSCQHEAGVQGTGLVQVEVIAVDGTKVHANASQHANRDYERIAREILEEAGRVDAEEDERFGDRRGDELPPELSTSQGRRGWLRDAKRRLDERRAEQARPIPASRPARLKDAKRRLEEELWTECEANAAYEAYRARGRMKDGRRFGRPPDPYQPPATPAGVINVTDPDSRNVKTSRGWVQGDNAQAVVTAEQIVIAAEVTVDSPDFGHLEPMVTAAQAELAHAGIRDTPQVVLADAGYWHQVQMETIVDRGMQVLIPPDAGKRKGTRPGWDGGLYAFMRRVLATDRGGGLYAKRQGHDRARVRRHQVQPPLRPLPTPRQIRRTVGMAADHGHPQSAQALAAHHGPDARLNRQAQPAASASAEAPRHHTINPTDEPTATFRNSLRQRRQTPRPADPWGRARRRRPWRPRSPWPAPHPARRTRPLRPPPGRSRRR